MSDLISRQAAIDALENDKAALDKIIKGMSAMDVRLDAYVSQRNQVDYDIYTINNLPPARPEQHNTNLAEVGTDAISRQKAINALYEWEFDNKDDRDAIDVINGLPPIQPKRGKWIRTGSGSLYDHYECSECGKAPKWECMGNNRWKIAFTDFCPMCGAKMEVTT